MPFVRVVAYSTFTDHKTGIRFNEFEDKRTRSAVGIAEVTEEQATELLKREGVFVRVSEDEFAQILGYKAPAWTSGDPLQDEAQRRQDVDAALDGPLCMGADPLSSAPPPPPSAS